MAIFSSKYLLSQSTEKTMTILEILYLKQSPYRNHNMTRTTMMRSEFHARYRGFVAVFYIMVKRKRKDENLSPLTARLLLERIFTPGYVPPQYLYDRYAKYSISKPGIEIAIYPLSESELAKINKPPRTTGK